MVVTGSGKKRKSAPFSSPRGSASKLKRKDFWIVFKKKPSEDHPKGQRFQHKVIANDQSNAEARFWRILEVYADQIKVQNVREEFNIKKIRDTSPKGSIQNFTSLLSGDTDSDSCDLKEEPPSPRKKRKSSAKAVVDSGAPVEVSRKKGTSDSRNAEDLETDDNTAESSEPVENLGADAIFFIVYREISTDELKTPILFMFRQHAFDEATALSRFWVGMCRRMLTCRAYRDIEVVNVFAEPEVNIGARWTTFRYHEWKTCLMYPGMKAGLMKRLYLSPEVDEDEFVRQIMTKDDESPGRRQHRMFVYNLSCKCTAVELADMLSKNGCRVKLASIRSFSFEEMSRAVVWFFDERARSTALSLQCIQLRGNMLIFSSEVRGRRGEQ